MEQEDNLASSDLEQEMSSSRSTSKGLKSSVDEGSLSTVRRVKKLDWDKLRVRKVDTRPSNDAKRSSVEGLLDLKLPELRGEQVEELQAIFRKFTRLTTNEVDYPQVEAVSVEFDRWKSKAGLAKIPAQHFLDDVQRCSFANEAVLQRTIMMEVIDRHQLNEILTFNCEGQWKQDAMLCLISTGNDKISLPKPDLNISFKLESFDESAPVPGNLKLSFRPDSDKEEYGQCFPFLFFEVKRTQDNLKVALMANLHSASQALFNMYTWMLKAQQAEIFFEKVRVFSFVFNAQDLLVRMHRATVHESTSLQYHFVELADLPRYSKDQVCLLVRRILEEYAIKELHPILKSAFEDVTSEYRRDVMKRKADEVQKAAATKRARNRRTPSLLPNVTTSFGLSALST